MMLGMAKVVRLVDPHPSPFAKSLPCAFPRELLN